LPTLSLLTTCLLIAAPAAAKPTLVVAPLQSAKRDKENADTHGSWAGRAVAPKQVVDLPPVTKIRAGFVHSCALTEVGTVYCWGQNHGNQMADGIVMIFDHPQRVDGP
jgi:alpha-tubulin suppressor-like RCC1 family protein